MRTVFIIFGSTGDLAKRKIFPALYNIYDSQSSGNIDIIATGRKEIENFRDFIQQETKEFIEQKENFQDFLSTIHYSQIDITKKDDYISLKEVIQQFSTPDTQVIIYLSIAPEHFVSFINNAKTLELSNNSKVIFEKPFGKDLESAEILNQKITEVFSEKQIYRIDHYVGKEAIQNILAFRFANLIFEPLWNNKYIDNIQITAGELIGIENRGEYYDASGALKDMVQNHLFQVLSLVTMDAPSLMDAESIAAEKLKVLKSIQPIQDFEKNIVFGQYEGYKNEFGVNKDSSTETFVALKLEVSNWKMIGVPIYLRTGKKLDKKSTHIVIEFKEIPDLLFKKFGPIEKNRVILEVQPNETIGIHFNIKQNGNSKEVQRVKSKFDKESSGKEAYQKLIEDAIIGDKTLFTTFDILKESWKIINTLVTCKENCPIIHSYIPGSNGPKAAEELLLRDNKKWYE